MIHTYTLTYTCTWCDKYYKEFFKMWNLFTLLNTSEKGFSSASQCCQHSLKSNSSAGKNENVYFRLFAIYVVGNTCAPQQKLLIYVSILRQHAWQHCCQCCQISFLEKLQTADGGNSNLICKYHRWINCNAVKKKDSNSTQDFEI